MNYKKIHDQIIERAMNRQLNCYTETHHIIPRCLGGTNDSINLVKLTAKEHFIVHKLLCEIYPDNVKIFFAYRMMSIMKNSKDNSRTYYIGSREFERIKNRHSNLMKEYNKKRSVSQETKDKISKSMTGKKRRPKSQETKDKISAALKGRKLSLEHRQNLSTSHKGQKAWNEGLVHTEESIEKMRNSTKKYWHNKKQIT